MTAGEAVSRNKARGGGAALRLQPFIPRSGALVGGIHGGHLVPPSNCGCNAPPAARRPLRAAQSFLVLFSTAWILSSCSSPTELYVFEGRKMGTSYQVKVADRNLSEQRVFELRMAVEAVFDAVDREMSTYRPDSELVRFNEFESDEPFSVSAETLEVFRHALAVSAITGGAFDITVGPLVAAWGFGAEGSQLGFPGAPLPTPSEIEAIRSRLGWGLIELNEQASTIAKRDPAVRCDLSAVAKGYAVDLAADKLGGMGFQNYLVELGGEIRTAGRKEEAAPWRVAIERPQTAGRETHRLLPLEDLALATSGDYRNFYQKDGRRYSHAIDPRSGRPVNHRLASVSVFDKLCVRADAYATALMVLGEVEGFRFAGEHGLAALFLVRDGGDGLTERTTPAFGELFHRRERTAADR